LPQIAFYIKLIYSVSNHSHDASWTTLTVSQEHHFGTVSDASVGTVSDASAPRAPVNVRSKVDAGAHGNEITWEAEVDFVGGLGGFIVLRDGHGIAKLPTAPLTKCMDARSFRDCPITTRPSHRFLR
jgi:hypothetical protein